MAAIPMTINNNEKNAPKGRRDGAQKL